MTHSPRRRSAGFTLLELLIALAITASTVALVFATYGVIGRTEQRAQDIIARTEHIQAVHNWLQRKLEGARLISRLEAGAVVLFFNGNPAGALWVAPLPERGPGGGLHVIRVALDRHADGTVDWVAEALPYDGALMQLDWTRAIRTPLAQGLRTLQWHYLDGQTGRWVQDWPSHRAYYPSRIRIEVADVQGPWPPLVFALARAR
ncbi:MAG: prepilin-type N-terminal cleavage/methylation domain-containing protein [Tepidimonas sp.]|nr:prepilin-type N-terminal cleavage/methylation domain-containing protein [Tepidimonas sp.]